MRQRLYLLLPALALAACQSEVPEAAQTDTAAAPTAEAATPTADTSQVRVSLINAQNQPAGTATLTQSAEGVQIALQLVNLPAGTHGVHIHQNGTCTPPFETAGGHFNPTSKQHGTENPHGPHAGDLPNVTIGDDGRVDTTLVATTVTLQPNQPNSLLKPGGTSLMVHASADDYKSDPSGNAGARIACGVIGQQQPQQ